MKKTFAALAAMSVMLQSGMPAYAIAPAASEQTRSSTLNDLIAACNALDENQYTPASWLALDRALCSAEALGEDAAQQEIDQAAAAVEAARAALELAVPNLALHKPVSVSGLEVSDGRFTADKAVDGEISASSRVSFAKDKDEQWMVVDLEEEKTISHVVIRYESTAPSFEIQVSSDNASWQSVYLAEGLKGQESSVQTIDFDAVSARYIRYVQHARWKHSGNGKYYSGSIYEFEVYERNPETSAVENIALNQSVSVSGLEVSDGRFTADKAVDGEVSAAIRVSFAKDQDLQWLLIDLNMRRTVSCFVINYESQAPAFKIQVSNDGEHFEDVYQKEGLQGQVSGIQKAMIEPRKARYVRYVQLSRWKHSGNGKLYSGSIYEFEIYRENPDAANAASVLEEIAGQAPVIENGRLVLPEVPDGFEISLYGCDNQQVVTMDGTVIAPLEPMNVHLLYQITSQADPSDTAASSEDILLRVPGRYTAKETDNARPSVMPGLREWKGGQGSFELGSDARLVVSDPSAMETAGQIAMYLQEMAGVSLQIAQGRPEKGDLYLCLDSAAGNLGSEGYLLDVDEWITITSSVPKGLLYGGISVTQILSQDAEHKYVPKGEARDYPKYEVRAGMLDAARTYVPLDYLAEMTRYMAYFKLNAVQVHINDYWGATVYSAFRLESETYPEITAKDGSYSKAEYRQYQQDMKAYGIDVITEIDTPYHAECFRPIEGAVMLKTGALDIREKSSCEIIENVLDEYLDGDDPVIQSEYFHIGTDEYDKAYSEQMRAWTDHFIKYVNNKGYKTRMWGSLGSKGFNGTTPVSIDAEVNLWAPYWADVHETYDAGYDIINTCGGWLYIVPGANAGYPDRLDLASLYDKFEVNNFAPSRNYGIGTAIMPFAHPQTKGAQFCLWNDMTSFGGGFSWFDLYDRFKAGVMIVSEKTWYGEKTEGQTAAQFMARADALDDKAPKSNPGRVVDSQGDLAASYDFETLSASGTFTDVSGNGYDGSTNASLKQTAGRTALSFDGSQSASLPFDTIGYPATVSFDLYLDQDCPEDAVLFEGKDGKLAANVKDSGKLGFERCGYQFSFEYSVPKETWVRITLVMDAKNTTLYVNGEKISAGTNLAAAINNRKDSNTFMFPFESMMANTKGAIDNLQVYTRTLSDAEVSDLAGIVQLPNLALNQPALASSVYPGKDWTADKAVDGIDKDASSRWGSKRATGQGNNDDAG